MTYFSFLLVFVGIPTVGLLALHLTAGRRERQRPSWWQRRWAGRAILLHCLIAVLYTTPWDNYLVASGVWWYDAGAVTGIVLGWVPLEEYVFFVAQTVLAGLWLIFWLRRLPSPASARPLLPSLRRYFLVAGLSLWVAALLLLLSGWQPGRYLALELVWALPPITLQGAFGADILWRYRRHVLAAIASLTLYLSAADALAISAGVWTINPAQSLPILLGGVLPLEEFLFFFLTNSLVVSGVTLLLVRESRARAAAWWAANKSTAVARGFSSRRP
jgi:lycopene beta-cyclase